jgi:hypothetical protein
MLCETNPIFDFMKYGTDSICRKVASYSQKIDVINSMGRQNVITGSNK